MTKKIKKIGVLCSGGDSPGMNCAIRAVVRTAIGEDLQIFGIQKGYEGLLENNIRELSVSSVGNILQHGGTILQTSRSKEFRTPEGRKKAADILKPIYFQLISPFSFLIGTWLIYNVI